MSNASGSFILTLHAAPTKYVKLANDLTNLHGLGAQQTSRENQLNLKGWSLCTADLDATPKPILPKHVFPIVILQ